MDLNIDVQRAQVWQKQVKEELSEVKVLLKQVTDCCKSDPAEDDTIIKMIVQTGETLDETWSALTNVFDKSTDVLGTAISSIGEGIQNSIEAISKFKDQIGR